jgi:hypothetical protein
MLTKEQALTLVRSLDMERWSERLTLDDGYDVRAKLMPDYDTNLDGDGDWYGALYPTRRNSNTGKDERPAKCNGAARKITTRDGAIWWQPPADLVSDVANLAKLEERVRGYFAENWSYVGIVLEMHGPACVCCGERKTGNASLWGIESDAGDYFAEVLTDLSSEVVAAAV